jgi:hypothetical protein
LTIAAVSAKDGADGCFVDKTLVRKTVSIETLDNAGEAIKVFVRSEAEGIHNEIKRLFPSEPLTSRGWTFQERLLSPRVLYFSSYELVWECNSMLLCSCRWRILDPGGRHSKSYFNEIFSNVVPKSNRQSRTAMQDLYSAWRDIIRQYSRRELTYDEDIFPALSGLAKLFPARAGDTYLAGLWRLDLHVGLLWSHSGRRMTLPDANKRPAIVPSNNRRCTTYCAPTWSWASIRGPVDYGCISLSSPLIQDTAEILEAYCEVSGKNRWGKVSNGFIKIKAPLLDVKLGKHEVDPARGRSRCRVGIPLHATNYPSDEDAVHWMEPEWAIMDIAYGKATDLDGQDRWAVRICVKCPPHVRQLSDTVGRFIEINDFNEDFAEEMHTFHYYLLLKRSHPDENTYERAGLFVKTVPPGQIWDPGKESIITII